MELHVHIMTENFQRSRFLEVKDIIVMQFPDYLVTVLKFNRLNLLLQHNTLQNSNL